MPEVTLQPLPVSSLSPKGELVKLPEDDVPESVLYPEIDSRTRTTAFEEFMRGAPISQIAIDHKLDIRTVQRWASKGKWIERLDEQRVIEAYEERRRMEQFRRDKREVELPAQFDALTRVQELLLGMVKEIESGDARLTFDGAKKLSEALKTVLDAKARVIGLNESGATTEQLEKLADSKEKGNGKTPMIAVIVGNTGVPLGKVVKKADSVVDIQPQ